MTLAKTMLQDPPTAANWELLRILYTGFFLAGKMEEADNWIAEAKKVRESHLVVLLYFYFYFYVYLYISRSIYLPHVSKYGNYLNGFLSNMIVFVLVGWLYNLFFLSLLSFQ